MKYSTRIALIGLLFLIGSPAFAQTAPAPQSCVRIVNALHIGSTDTYTGGEVSVLQNFLVTEGYFTYTNLGTGRFGPITYRAVVAYQLAHGISGTGYVGPLTRANIGAQHCTTTTSPVSLYYVSPTTASVGTSVSVTGFGFTSHNTVMMDNSVIARDVPITSSIAVACTTDPTCRGGIRQTIVVTVPSALAPYCKPGYACAMYMRLLTPGTYNVTVENENGTSGSLPLTIVDSSSNQSVSITGLDAPSTLPIGQSGTWTVHVNSPSTTSNLQYTVVWGDEVQYATASGIRAPDTTTISNSASFTHSYSRSGTYTPTFSVTDSGGHTATTNSTVTVTPQYTY